MFLHQCVVLFGQIGEAAAEFARGRFERLDLCLRGREAVAARPVGSPTGASEQALAPEAVRTLL